MSLLHVMGNKEIASLLMGESDKKPRKNGNRAYKVETLIEVESNGINSLYKQFTKQAETINNLGGPGKEYKDLKSIVNMY